MENESWPLKPQPLDGLVNVHAEGCNLHTEAENTSNKETWISGQKCYEDTGVQVIIGGVDDHPEKCTSGGDKKTTVTGSRCCVITDEKMLERSISEYCKNSDWYDDCQGDDRQNDDAGDYPWNQIGKKAQKGKKGKKGKRAKDNVGLYDSIESHLIPNILAFPGPEQDLPKKMTEDMLYRIMINTYIFGCFGSFLYVRDQYGVYSVVDQATVEMLLMKALSPVQLEHFTICSARPVLKRLLASPEIVENKLVFPLDKMLFLNGCFNIVTGKPVKPEISDFFQTRINARYLPNEGLPCPLFDSYLETASNGDPTVKKRIRAMIGYLLLPGYPGRKVLIMGTQRRSGKSVIARLVQELVGEDLVCGQNPNEIKDRFALSEFHGAIVNMALDIPNEVIRNKSIGTIKALSGGDRVSMEFKGKTRKSGFCVCKQVFGTNNPIRLESYDEAFWERTEVIPFLRSVDPTEKVERFEETLLAHERDAIVTKCVKSARKLVKNGYIFPECPVAEEMKESWMGWRGYAMRFLRTYCERDLEAFTPSDILYEKYREQCAIHSYPYGEQTGFILLAKEMYPPIGNCRKMENGEQRRGLPGVRFLGIA